MSKALDAIRNVAIHQEGVFATDQVDVTDQALSYHTKQGTLERLRRGIYRLTHVPHSEDEEYIVAYLWSDQEGVISHETALMLHNLSDALPSKIHLTVPTAWKESYRSVPDTYRLHLADLSEAETTWYGAVPITTPLRTLKDVAASGLEPDLVEQAIDQAMARGLVGDEVEREILRFLILRASEHE